MVKIMVNYDVAYLTILFKPNAKNRLRVMRRKIKDQRPHRIKKRRKKKSSNIFNSNVYFFDIFYSILYWKIV